MDTIIGKKTNCLDHGFVQVMDIMGSDEAIVEAARTSYGEGTKKISETPGLLNYLLRHHHTTPFEMCEIKFLCQMPIFVARQWVRHRTASINEYSMRYSEPIDLYYVPKPEHLAPQSKTNKQGREHEGYNDDQKEAIRDLIVLHSDDCFHTYKMLASEDSYGLARELSRMVLPVNAYTRWVWKIDVNNLLKFLILRMDSHAQYEIRVFADAMAAFVKEWLPLTWDAFEEHMLYAVTFSRKEQRILRQLMLGTPLGEIAHDIGKGQYAEFVKKLLSLQE